MSAYSRDPFCRFPETGLQTCSQNHANGVVYTNSPSGPGLSAQRINPSRRGRRPLSTKIKRGFLPNTAKKEVSLPRLPRNSIRCINTHNIRIANPEVYATNELLHIFLFSGNTPLQQIPINAITQPATNRPASIS